MITTLWYKVRHPWFDPNMAYRAIDYVLHSETAWAHLVFIVPTGHTFAIQVHRCTALPRTCEWNHIEHWRLHRPQTETEALFPWAETPVIVNPDLATDLQ